MPMRDDREALRARVEALTSDLDAAQRESDTAQEKLDSLAEVERERDRLASELAKVRGALAEATGEPTPAWPSGTGWPARRPLFSSGAVGFVIILLSIVALGALAWTSIGP